MSRMNDEAQAYDNKSEKTVQPGGTVHCYVTTLPVRPIPRAVKHTGQAWGGACELTVLRSDPLGETVVANCLSEPLASVAQ